MHISDGVENTTTANACRSERYLEAAPEMSAFLEQLSPWLADGFFWIKGYSDYHPDKGGDPLGRGVWAKPLDLKNVGPEADQIRRPLFGRAGVPRGAWMTSIDYVQLVNFGRSGVRGKLVLARLAKRILRHRLLGERMATSGQALIMRLRLALRDAGVPLWLNTPLKSLITDASGGVVGAQVEHDGTPMRIRARHGVVLTTGGFDHNPELRKRHHPEIEHEWSMGSPDNTGDGIQAGSAVGAATDLMDHAWWMPGVKLPTGAMFVPPNRRSRRITARSSRPPTASRARCRWGGARGAPRACRSAIRRSRSGSGSRGTRRRAQRQRRPHVGPS